MADDAVQDVPDDGPPAADALLEASVVGLGLVIRSLAPALERVTLQQYRILVLLVTDGAMRAGDLAQDLGLLPSGVTRMVSRLVRDGFVERHPVGREVEIAATASAIELVTEVFDRRRTAFRGVLRTMTDDERSAVRQAAAAFAGSRGPAPSIDARLLLAVGADQPRADEAHGRRDAPRLSG